MMNELLKNNIQQLSAIEVTKIYPHPIKKQTNIPLFAGVSFEMTSEQPNFIVGVSGTGKTTLLKMIMGIESISAGEILLGETIIHHLQGSAKANYLKKIGYLDQFPSKYLSLSLTVKENLDYALILRQTSLDKGARQRKIISIAKMFTIDDLLEQETITLSGGELRRLSLASNMIFSPRLLLCDEPTAQLDKENSKMIMECILRINKQYNTLVIIATHDHSILLEKSTYEIKGRRILKW